MTYVKNVGISFGFIIASILGFTLLVTLLHDINWIGVKTLSILEIIIPMLAMFLGGFQIGKRSKQKGWLEGIKLSLLFLILLILFQYLGLHSNFSIKSLLFYFLIIISSVLGSMVGINRKIPNKN